MNRRRKLLNGTSLLFSIVLVGSSASTIVAHAQLAGVAAVATSGAAVDALMGGIKDSINRAKDAGDYVTAIALARALEALDAWKKTNSELLDKAFSELDVASRENFGRIRATVLDIDAKVGDRLENANRLTLSANQLVASLPGGRPFISNFVPRVIPPTAKSSYNLRVYGVSLDKAEPSLQLGGGSAQRLIVGAQEVQFAIPETETPRDQSAIQMHTLHVTYTQPKAGFWSWVFGKTETVSRQLPVIALPRDLASYKVEAIREYDKRETSIHQVDLGTYRGKNEEITRAGAPLNGWKWDISDRTKFTFWGTGGEAAKCQEIVWRTTNEYSISVMARVDRVGSSMSKPAGGPGKITCHVKGPIYRDNLSTETIPAMTGTLGWTEDVVVKLPEGVKSYTVTVWTFDGRKKVFTSEDADKFFEVRRSGNTLTLIPRVPADVI